MDTEIKIKESKNNNIEFIKPQGNQNKKTKTKNYKNNQKPINKMAKKYKSINNYFKWKCTKCSYQTAWGS